MIRGASKLRPALVLLAVIAGALCSAGAAAQTVQGRLFDEAGEPISTAQVTLLDMQDRTVNAALSSTNGNFSIRLRTGGEFRLRVERGGFEPYTSPPFNLAAGQGFSTTLTVPSIPILLDVIEVEVVAPPFRSLRFVSEAEIDELWISAPSLSALLRARFASHLVSDPQDPYGEVVRLVTPPMGCSAPLFAVDGVPTDAWIALSYRPTEISTIEFVRMDAARLAWYGLRGGCGVVEIKTRR